VTTYTAQSIVFIDSRVPDLQGLLDGLQPGEQAFVIDSSSDGIEQIADILAANNFTDLSSISIVSHGDSGELELGSSLITDGNLSSHSNALAEIGASLAPGGAIQLYGCDVALGTGGQQFINDFSTLAGGVAVEASTHTVGSAALGADWTLDAASTNGTSSTPVAPADAPFTPAALANFQGDLAASPVTEVWMTATGGSNDSAIVHDDDTGNGTGTNSVTLFHESLAGNPSTNYPSSLSNLTNIQLDPTDNLYFLAEQNEGIGSNPNAIWVGTLAPELTNPTGTPTLTSIYSQSGAVNTTGVITGLGIDPTSQKVFFTEHQALLEVAYTGGTVTTLAAATGAFHANGLALDIDHISHNEAFFFSTTTNGTFTTNGGVVNVLTTNVIYVDSNLAATSTTTPVAMTLNGSTNFPATLGEISGIAVDTTSQKLYFTTDPNRGANKSTGTGGIFEYDLSQGNSGTVNTIWVEPSSGSLFLSYIQIDHATNRYYVTGDQAADANPGVYDGALSGGTAAQSPTLFANLTMTSITQNAQGLAIDNAPSLTISALTPTFTESSLNPASAHNTPVGLISGDTASDTDNPALRGAAVTIGGFFAGDTLSVSTAGTSISSSYNSSTGVLTLSGLDSFAHYQTALATVQFTSTSDNPTDFGSDNSRALTWVVNDGLITSAPQTSTVTVVGVNDPPTLTPAASAHYTEEGAAGVLSSAASVVDVDDLNLSSATVAITGGSFAGDTDVLAANTSGTSISASYNSNTQTLTLTGTDTLAHYQTVLDSVNFTSGENPTNYGSNQTRILTWQLMDPSGTASGGVATSALATTTLTVTNVNDAPTLASVASSVNFTEGTPVTLSGAVSVTDPDNLGLQGATVVIATGTFTADGDTLTTSTTGTHITASYNTTNETLTLTGSDTLANYQTVLDRITFGSGQNPDDYGSNKTRTVTWVLNDGSGSFNLSTAKTETISITAINDPPVLSNVATSVSYTENVSQFTLSPSATVTDVDNLNLAGATISIVGGAFGGDGDVLRVNGVSNGTINGVSISYNSTTEVLTLTGTDTLAHYQTDIEQVNFTSTSHNPTNYGSNPTRTLTWVLNDGSSSNNLSSLQTTTLSITALNDPPTLASVASSVHFTEEGGAVTLSGAVTVTDPDNLNLASATVSITGGTFSGDADLLAASTTGTSITASYDSTNERLILSGADTLANYQTVLDSITFNAGENPTDFGSNLTRTVSWVLNDGSASSATSAAQIETISITNVNDAPTLAGTAASTSYTELGTAAVLSPSVTVSDPDNQKLTSATVKIVGGTFAGDGDVLTFSTAGTNVTASYNAGTETLTLSGSDVLANYQTVLDTVAFSSTSHNPDDFGSNPTRTVTWVLNDGSTSSTAQTEIVSIIAINDPPTLAGTATSVTFTENGAATVLSNAVVVTDPDNQNLASATVSITAGAFANDGDVLAANTGGTSITASYDSNNERLILSGSDTTAHYQQVLDTITFSSTSDNPDDYGADPTRTVSWVLNDGSTSSTAQIETVSIKAINDPPTLSGVPASDTYVTGTTVTLAPTVTVADPDNLNLATATVSITGGTFANDGDVLTATNTGVITSSYDTTNERLILTGSDTLDNYRLMLDTVRFSSSAADPTNGGLDLTRTITWIVNDGSLSSTVQTTTLSIQNGPAINPPAHAAFTEGQPSVTLAPSLSVTDSNNASITSVVVAITAGMFALDGDTLAAEGLTNGTFTGADGTITISYDAGAETLTLSGPDSVADYKTVLDTVTFTTPSHNPTDFGADPSRTVVWTITDNSGSTNSTSSATSTIDITAINDPPTLAGTATSVTFTENGAAAVLSNAVVVTDPDNQNLASATVSITGGTFANDGDVLAANTGGTSITASYDSNNERLILSGSDTTAHYQQVLDTITFSSTSDNPDDYGADPTRTVTWVLNDGSASSATSAAQTETVSIIAINDPPTLANAAITDAFTAGQTITLAAAASVTDPDSLNLVGATVSISSGAFAGDVLAAEGLTNSTFVQAGTITISYDAGTETLTLTGSDTLADYQNVLDSVTFSSSAADPTNAGGDPARQITWVLNDGAGSSNTSAPVTTTVSIHSGPAVFNTTTAQFVENAPSTALSPAVSVSDTNATTLASATVALTGGTFAGDGDQLAVDATVLAGTGISASYDAANEVLTLTSIDTLAHYQQVLESVTFTTASDNPTEFGADPTRTVTWTVNDGTTTGTTSSILSITAVNDPPTLTNTAPSVSFVENAGPVVLSSNVTVSDPDNLNLASATVSITGGTFANDGDVLAVNTGGTSITASYDSTNERLVLTGSDTTAHYQQVLDTLTFNSTSDNPDDFGADPTRTVSWVLNDGAGSSNLSAAQIETVSITAINDPPTLTNVASPDSFTVGSTITLSPSVTVSDPDNQNLAGATVSITGGTFVSDGDVLSAEGTTNGTFVQGGHTITISYSGGSETLTLTGSDTLADYRNVLDSVTFSSGNNPNNSNNNSTRTVSWVLNDGAATSTAQFTTISIAHEPPILTSVASSLAFSQGQTLVISPSVTVTDFDSTSLSSATVSIAGGTFVSDGDVLSAEGTTNGTFVQGGHTITISYSAGSETLTLTGTDTLLDYENVLDTVKFSSGSDPTNHGADPTRTVTWVVNDGNASLGQSNFQTTTISITPSDQPPTLSSVTSSVNFTENGASVTLSSTLSVSDPDNPPSMTSATVSIAGGVFVGDNDVLGFGNTTGTNIVASYNSSTETLTLTGADTLAHYKQVLDSVTFIANGDNPTFYGSDPTRIITWVVKDDFNIGSAPVTETVSITAVNDPPTLTSVAGSVSFLEGSTIQLSPTTSVSDPDNLNVANATVKITGGTFAGDGDQLTANVAGTHVTASYDGASETLTLTGSDPLATYQAVLDSVSFSSGSNPTNYGSNLTRTVTWVVNDGSGSFNLSNVATETISITAVNDPPAISQLTDSQYTEHGAAVTLSSGASVSDPDNQKLANATVQIVGGTFAGDSDLLAFSTASTSISASYNSSTETLTLTGSDTLADYQQVLDSITFSASENPTNYGSDAFRTITWVLNDGSASNNLSTVETTTVTITNVNDPPTLTNIPSTVSYTEEGAATITLASTASLSDPDNLTFVDATVSITGGTFVGDGDVLAANVAGTNIAASYNSSSETLTLTGSDTTANYAQVLDSVTFTTRLENPNNFGSDPTRTIVWTVNDGSASTNFGSATTTVSITNVNDAPTLANVATTAFFTEHGGAAILSSAVSVSDPDNLKLANATVAITGGAFAGDILAATAVGNVTVSYNSTTETLALTGSDTLANYQSVLDTVTFNAGENPTNFGSNPTRTVVWTLNDGSGSFFLSTPVTETIGVTNINDAPTLGNVATTAFFTEEGGAVTLSSSVSVSDPDDVNLSGATVKITGGTFANDQDVLSANTASTSITASYNSSTETLTLSGTDTLAHYQSVLNSVTFNAGENPTDYGSNPTRTLSWTLMDPSGTANGGVNVSTPVTSTVSITNVNDPPTLSNVAASAAVTLVGQTITVSPAASVSDPDNLQLANATVKVTGGTFAGDGDVLGATAVGSITVSYNAATETLALTGSDTLAHYQAVLDSVTFNSTNSNPTNSGVDRTRTVTWTLNDGSGSNNLSSPATTTISFQSVPPFDFNGDFNSDLVFQFEAFNAGSATGTPGIWLMNGATPISQVGLPNPGASWHVITSRDVNGDGKADLIWQNNDGTPGIWLMNGTTPTAEVGLANPGASWHIVASGDTNGDGDADLIWRNADGTLGVWEMNGTTPISQAGIGNPGASWKVVGAADFNGDGRDDILLQNSTNGNLMVDLMNGTSITSSVTISLGDPSWHAVSTGVFNGVTEIAWQNSNGTPGLWLMNGTTPAAEVGLPNPGSGWQLVSMDHFTPNGQADLLFQNASGAMQLWEMNGTSIAAEVNLPNPGTGWISQNGHPFASG